MNILNVDEVRLAYEHACKMRDARSMKLYQLRNPSIAKQKFHSEASTFLRANLGIKEGGKAWMVYLRQLRDEKCTIERERKKWKEEAHILNRVLRFYRRTSVK